MYDIIFDFSASPSGGGLLRLLEYIRFFNNHNNNVLFLVHSKVPVELYKGSKCKIVVFERNPLKRIFFDHLFLKKYIGQAYCFFSYGIPIYKRVAKKNWMHLSNALPFGYKKCSLSFKNRIKNYVLFSKFKNIDPGIEFISGESQSTIDLFSEFIESKAKKIVLYNGFDKSIIINVNNSNRDNIALTVGGGSYKRLDLVYDCYLNIKKKNKIRELVIIADQKTVPDWIKKKQDVRIIDYLYHEELMKLYRNSEYYISMSEIENSSNAVLEALYCGCTVFLSKIPSHIEMFSGILNDQFYPDYLIATKDDLKKENSVSWDEIIKKMCTVMELKLT